MELKIGKLSASTLITTVFVYLFSLLIDSGVSGVDVDNLCGLKNIRAFKSGPSNSIVTWTYNCPKPQQEFTILLTVNGFRKEIPIADISTGYLNIVNSENYVKVAVEKCNVHAKQTEWINVREGDSYQREEIPTCSETSTRGRTSTTTTTMHIIDASKTFKTSAYVPEEREQKDIVTNPSEPEGPSALFIAIWVILAILLALVVTLGVVCYRQRKRKQGQARKPSIPISDCEYAEINAAQMQSLKPAINVVEVVDSGSVDPEKLNNVGDAVYSVVNKPKKAPVQHENMSQSKSLPEEHKSIENLPGDNKVSGGPEGPVYSVVVKPKKQKEDKAQAPVTKEDEIFTEDVEYMNNSVIVKPKRTGKSTRKGNAVTGNEENNVTTPNTSDVDIKYDKEKPKDNQENKDNLVYVDVEIDDTKQGNLQAQTPITDTQDIGQDEHHSEYAEVILPSSNE